jgi:hypothetical protein
MTVVPLFPLDDRKRRLAARLLLVSGLFTEREVAQLTALGPAEVAHEAETTRRAAEAHGPAAG